MSENQRSTGSKLGRVLLSLSDATCRTILREARAEPLTAEELVERCDRSRSTVYRKLRTLVESGLLDRSTRIRTDDKDADQFETSIDSVLIELTEDGLRLEFDPSIAPLEDADETAT